MYEVIVRKQWQPTNSEVLEAADYDGGHLDDGVLGRRIADLSADLRRALEAMRALVPAGTEHAPWTEFRRQHSLPVVDSSAWEWMYEQLTEAEEAQAQEEARRSSPSASWAAPRDPLPGSLLHSYVPPSQIVSLRQQGYEDRLVERRDDADAAVSALRAELRLAEETYQAARQPEGFELALRALRFLALVGIGVPLIVMAIGPETLHWSARAGVLLVFFVGVVVLLRYLFVYAHFLDEEHRVDRLPGGLLGLFRRAGG